MYNGPGADPADLPSSARLLKSTLLALVAAAVILVTIVLPAEYAIDPTGIGRALGLTEMGEIKARLENEAAADHGDEVVLASIASDDDAWGDEVDVTLAPDESTEIKLVMDGSAEAAFEWTSSAGLVFYDLHGDGGGEFVSYEKGSSTKETGTLTAKFAGSHGWYWKNRTRSTLTVTLRVRGAYTDIKRSR